MLPLPEIEVRFLGRSPHTLVTILTTESRLADGQCIMKTHYLFTSLVTQGQLKSQTKAPYWAAYVRGRRLPRLHSCFHIPSKLFLS